MPVPSVDFVLTVVIQDSQTFSDAPNSLSSVDESVFVLEGNLFQFLLLVLFVLGWHLHLNLVLILLGLRLIGLIRLRLVLLSKILLDLLIIKIICWFLIIGVNLFVIWLSYLISGGFDTFRLILIRILRRNDTLLLLVSFRSFIRFCWLILLCFILGRCLFLSLELLLLDILLNLDLRRSLKLFLGLLNCLRDLSRFGFAI